MNQITIMPIDLLSANEQIRLCYEFARSADFFYQELSILNPFPTQFDQNYIFPRDMFLFIYCKDYDQTQISFDDLAKMVEKNHAPIQCIGSHRSDMDRTIQLIWTPAEGGRDPQLIVQFLSGMTSNEKSRIIEDLQAMAKHEGEQ